MKADALLAGLLILMLGEIVLWVTPPAGHVSAGSSEHWAVLGHVRCSLLCLFQLTGGTQCFNSGENVFKEISD